MAKTSHDGVGLALFFYIVLLIGLGMVIFPLYGVWQQGLKRGEQDRQIAVQEAMASKESASLLADAEILRAHGVAEANDIIADGLGGPEGYLRYLWIQQMDNAKVVYIPTEAGIPILEAGRAMQK